MRTTIIHRTRVRPTRLLAAVALAAAVSGSAAACSSAHTAPSAAAGTPSATGSAALLSQDCTNVSDVLSDGPDPTADAVGYAQAQILPLQQLSLGDAAVHTAVDQLDTAFGTFVNAKGSAQTQAGAKVTAAENALNDLCPGVAP